MRAERLFAVPIDIYQSTQRNIAEGFIFRITCVQKHALAHLVETLHYKPEGRGFDSR